MCLVGGAAFGSIGSAMATIGTVTSVVGQFVQARSTQAAMSQHAQDLEAQKQQTRALSSIREWRTRQKMRAEMRQQAATIGARGLDLASPTAQFLGQTAAAEMAFAGQAIRQDAQATTQELTSQQRAARARGRDAMFKGKLSAASTMLTAAPEIWPELLA